MSEIASGQPAIDRYLVQGYTRVRGMSSRFAAAICGHLIHRQSETGISGHIAEIGAFEGRFFIAMALGLAPGENALAIDVFTWPDEGILGRFLANCDAHGLARERVIAWKADTSALTPDQLRAKLPGGFVRFIHIDGDHRREFLAKDLELAHAVLHPSGIICVDDMMHPSYPMLITAVLDYLARHEEMRVLCVIDREDIVAAAKLLLCREDSVARYQHDLVAAFASFRFYINADMGSYGTIVLTPRPLIIDIG